MNACRSPVHGSLWTTYGLPFHESKIIFDGKSNGKWLNGNPHVIHTVLLYGSHVDYHFMDYLNGTNDSLVSLIVQFFQTNCC